MKRLFIFLLCLQLMVLNSSVSFAEGCWGCWDLNCVPDGVTSAGKTSDPTFLAGYVDVTWYGADPTGVNDSTTAIQTAINEARSCNYGVFFPHQTNGSQGRYKITDTLNCRLRYGCDWRDGCRTIWLIGDRSVNGVRPEIFLEDNTSGFTDSNNPKPMIRYWQQPTTTGDDDWTLNDTDVNFGQTFRGIDITTGNNAGAIGIEIPAAQGASVTDSEIDATGGFACIANPACLGMGIMNVTMKGGQYAIWVDTDAYGEEGQKAGAGVSIVGDTFQDQTAAIIGFEDPWDWTQTTVFVGCYFTNNNLNVVLNNDTVSGAMKGGFQLYDCIVEGNNTTTAWIYKPTDNQVVIRNSYFKGISTIVDGLNISNTTNWAWVKYYTNDGDNSGEQYWVNLVNGVETTNTTYKYIEEGKTYTLEELQNSLVNAHIWDEWSFPDWQDADIHNVKDLGVKGDGVTDDAVAIQSAINTYEKLFFPRGKYVIKNTITLKANTKIIGSGFDNCIIMPHPDWQPDISSRTLIVDTEDSSTGDAILAFIKIGHHQKDHNNNRTIDTWIAEEGTEYERACADQFQFQHIRWRIGANSMIRSVYPGKTRPWEDVDHYKLFDVLEVTGNGGGRWWMVRAGDRGCQEDSKVLYVHDTTGQKLRVYAWNDANCPNSDKVLYLYNASNFYFYFPTHEMRRWFTFENCSNFAVFGSHGNGNAPSDTDRGIYTILNCDNYELLGLRENLYQVEDTYNTVYSEYGGNSYNLVNKNVTRLIRGAAEYISITEEEPNPPTTTPFTGCSFTGGGVIQ